MAELHLELDPPFTNELAERLTQIWTEVSNADGAVGFVPPVTIDDVKPVADEAFTRVRRGVDHLVLVRDGDQVIGFMFLEKRPGPLFRHWATIKRLQILPSLQGQGHGGTIIELLHDLAREQLNLEQIHLTVRGGTGLERFYLAHGYTEVARIPGMIRVAPGDDRDEIYMLKQL